MTKENREVNSLTNRFLFVRNGNLLEKLDINDILYIRSDGNYCHIHLKQRKYVVKKSLVKMAEILPKSVFFRVHMKSIVALNKIIKIDLSVNKIFISDSALAIGPKYRSVLLKLLNPI